MANQMLTEIEILELVELAAVERGIVPMPKAFVDKSWCPERLYIGTVHTSLTTACRILTPALFEARVIRPLLDCMVGTDRAHVLWQNTNIPVTASLLDQRGATHGDYRAMSTRIQQIKTIMRMGSRWTDMSEPQKEALELIATKIGRIIEGDPEYLDHWIDGAGYFTKGSEFCRKETTSA